MLRTLLFTFFLIPLSLLGQKEYTLSFTGEDYKRFKKNPKSSFKDSLKLKIYLQDWVSSARNEGFVLANVEQKHFRSDTCFVDFHLGPKFKKVHLSMNEEEKEFLFQSFLSPERFLLNPSFNPIELNRLLSSWQSQYLNNGYPFAKLTLKMDSVSLDEGFARVEIEKGKFLNWSRVYIKGDSSISASFVSSLLQIKVGEPYSEERKDAISQKLKQVTFISETKPNELLFTSDGVELYLYLNSKPVSSLNGYLGLQPNAANDRYALAGDLALKLHNVIKKGELFDLHWRNIQGQTQQLKTLLNLPFLFQSPFGIDARFQLYKRDSSFLDIQSRLALEYQLGGGSKLFFYYQRNVSSVLKAGLTSVAFPNLANVSSNNYGLGFTYNRLDYLPNPRSGLNLTCNSAVGSRVSRAIDSLKSQNSTQFSGSLQLDVYFPLSSRQVLRLGNQSWFLNANPIFQNELYRFGGLLNQRGFNEDDFFGSTATTSTLEYRFLLDKDSRLFAFYDLTWYENNSLSYFNDTPYGFGAGMAFGTNIGTFSILYALGSQQSNPIEIQNGRVHFGYIAYF